MFIGSEQTVCGLGTKRFNGWNIVFTYMKKSFNTGILQTVTMSTIDMLRFLWQDIV